MAEADWYRGWQDVRPEDVEQVVQLLNSGSVSIVSGGIMARFEKRFAAFAGQLRRSLRVRFSRFQ